MLKKVAETPCQASTSSSGSVSRGDGPSSKVTAIRRRLSSPSHSAWGKRAWKRRCIRATTGERLTVGRSRQALSRLAERNTNPPQRLDDDAHRLVYVACPIGQPSRAAHIVALPHMFHRSHV